VERRPRQDDAIEEGDGDAHRHTREETEAAAAGAVQVNGLPHAGIAGWERVGLPVDHEADVADEALVEDGVDGLAS
jgi:hypothetical protein